MINEKIDKEDESVDNEDSESLSEDDLKKNITIYSSYKLCDIVIAYRYLGMFKNLFMSCMEELGKRRSSGDNFDFEAYIDNNLLEMPKIDIKGIDIASTLQKLNK